MKDLIKKILKEQDDFDWIRDIKPSLDIDSMPTANEWGGYYLFYFYPYITRDEYTKYVLPILLNTFHGFNDKIQGGIIDHVEVHLRNKEFLGGSVEYFDAATEEAFLEELAVDYSTINNGREIFNIK